MRRKISAVLLAGGKAQRMGGGDKCLRLLGGRTLLEHVVERVRPQVGPIVLNANGDADRFHSFDLPVAQDIVAGFAGPLAGILTGMRWTSNNAAECDWMLSVPTDSPFIPYDLVSSLLSEIEQNDGDIACAVSCGRKHPVVGLWPVRLAYALERALIDENMRKIDLWTGRYRVTEVSFPSEKLDPFFNANQPEDLLEAEQLLLL